MIECDKGKIFVDETCVEQNAARELLSVFLGFNSTEAQCHVIVHFHFQARAGKIYRR